MKKEEILKASRQENKNRDLAEMEVMRQAGTCAGSVGALVCCVVSLLSSTLAHIMLYSPWAIYFSIMTAQWSVRFIRMRRRSDLVLAVLFLILAVLAFVGLIERLMKVRA